MGKIHKLKYLARLFNMQPPFPMNVKHLLYFMAEIKYSDEVVGSGSAGTKEGVIVV